ncbi:MAG: FMN-binding protein [Bacteroidales bacterium]|nr:FMN-binding protein [Bacteroidales bacterium]
MNANVYGSAPALAYDKYEKRLLDKQRFSDIDAVSGATYSLQRLKYAVWLAIISGPQQP